MQSGVSFVFYNIWQMDNFSFFHELAKILFLFFSMQFGPPNITSKIQLLCYDRIESSFLLILSDLGSFCTTSVFLTGIYSGVLALQEI